MTFYTRYVVTDELPLQLGDLEAALQSVHHKYAIDNGLLLVDGREIGVIDITVRGDPICDGDLDLLQRLADSSPRWSAVASQIAAAKYLVCVQGLSSMDDAIENALLPLWDWLLKNRHGVLAIEGGRFIASTCWPS